MTLIKRLNYFESHHLNLHTVASGSQQSKSAVHYLAISPPRIRITDDTGSVSPDMFGMRLQKKNSAKMHRETVQQLNMTNNSLTKKVVPDDCHYTKVFILDFQIFSSKVSFNSEN